MSFGFYKILTTKSMYREILNLIPTDQPFKMLECGIGYGIWAFALRMWSKKELEIHGIDMYKPYIEKQRKHSLYNDVKYANATDLPYKDNSFDIVIAPELIEHLTRSEGYKFIEEIYRVSSYMCILTTPKGYYEIENPADDNDKMNHRSGWEESDFLEKGFTVKVVDKTNLRRRSLKFFDNIRRILFRLGERPKGLIAYKIKPQHSIPTLQDKEATST